MAQNSMNTYTTENSTIQMHGRLQSPVPHLEFACVLRKHATLVSKGLFHWVDMTPHVENVNQESTTIKQNKDCANRVRQEIYRS